MVLVTDFVAGIVVFATALSGIMVINFGCCRKRRKKDRKKDEEAAEDKSALSNPEVQIRNSHPRHEESIMRVPDRALLNVPVPVPLQRRRSGYDKRGRSHEAPVRFDVAMALESFEKYLGRYEIEEKRLKLGEVLGRGKFGMVYKGTLMDNCLRSPRAVTVKTVQGCTCTTLDVTKFVEEVLMMVDFEHENVLSMVGLVVKDDKPCALMPFMEHGDLRTYIASPQQHFTIKLLLTMGLQISQGMAYLSSRNFVHKDLAARNCMLDKDMIVKVADFGLSRDIFDTDYSLISSLSGELLPIRWMALESLTDLTFTTQADVWSFGVLLWELLTRGQAPYGDMDGVTVIACVRTGRLLERPAVCPRQVYNMMMNCWKSDPGTRPSFPSLEEDLRAILDGGTSHNTPPADSATPPARQDDGSRSGIPDPWHPDPSSADSRPASGMEDKATDDKYREFLKEI